MSREVGKNVKQKDSATGGRRSSSAARKNVSPHPSPNNKKRQLRNQLSVTAHFYSIFFYSLISPV